jgi:uncharacterized protein YbjT (DUF2867 family)
MTEGGNLLALKAQQPAAPGRQAFERPLARQSPILSECVLRKDRNEGAAGAVCRSGQGSQMRVLLLGANGFIGSACMARLIERGVQVRAVVRRRGLNRDRVEWEEANLDRLVTPQAWAALVEGCDAVVNCAGVLTDSPGDSTRAVHQTSPAALYEACERAGTKRVVLLSAVGVEDGRTPFARTKREGEIALQRHDLDWIILRPSIVLGEAASGGGALLRGLAALPALPLEKGQGRIQPVQLEEVVATIIQFLEPDAPSRLTLELAGPQKLSLPEAAAAYRRWLGWKPASHFVVPRWLMAPVYAAGEIANRLGWRTPISRTGWKEIQRGAEGDTSLWRQTTGLGDQTLDAALASRPAGGQERLFASLYFLKPLAFVITSLFWIGTGVVSLGPGYGIGIALMEEGRVGPLSGPSVIAGGLADIVIGLGIAYRPTARLALWAAVGISIFYFVAGTILLPRLWLDPIGPMLKIWPLVVLNILCIALLQDRR